MHHSVARRGEEGVGGGVVVTFTGNFMWEPEILSVELYISTTYVNIWEIYNMCPSV